MNSFDKIRDQIQKDIESQRENNPVAVAGKTNPNLGTDGKPTGNGLGIIGTPVSKPGTEQIILEASTFQFMECQTAAKNMNKKRYCIVEKGVRAQYGNQYINSTGDLTHVVTRQVFQLMLGVIQGAARQIRQLATDVKTAEQQRDMYKMTIDALRKNGIID